MKKIIAGCIAALLLVVLIIFIYNCDYSHDGVTKEGFAYQYSHLDDQNEWYITTNEAVSPNGKYKVSLIMTATFWHSGQSFGTFKVMVNNAEKVEDYSQQVVTSGCDVALFSPEQEDGYFTHPTIPKIRWTGNNKILVTFDDKETVVINFKISEDEYWDSLIPEGAEVYEDGSGYRYIPRELSVE